MRRSRYQPGVHMLRNITITIHSSTAERYIKRGVRLVVADLGQVSRAHIPAGHRTKSAAKGSGDRVIAPVDDVKLIVTILLVYSKNEITIPNETAKRQKEVKDNFPALRDLVKWNK